MTKFRKIKSIRIIRIKGRALLLKSSKKILSTMRRTISKHLRLKIEIKMHRKKNKTSFPRKN